MHCRKMLTFVTITVHCSIAWFFCTNVKRQFLIGVVRIFNIYTIDIVGIMELPQSGSVDCIHLVNWQSILAGAYF